MEGNGSRWREIRINCSSIRLLARFLKFFPEAGIIKNDVTIVDTERLDHHF